MPTCNLIRAPRRILPCSSRSSRPATQCSRWTYRRVAISATARGQTSRGSGSISSATAWMPTAFWTTTPWPKRPALHHPSSSSREDRSAYPRSIDFERFRAVADEVGAILLVDMAHWAGLVAAGLHPDPVPVADVVTATTYKNLRGVRGGFILSHRADLARKLNSAVFPGVQGSVILNAVAAKAVAFREAMTPEFQTYAEGVLDNARALAAALVERDIAVLTGGTDTPLLLIDLRPLALTGAAVSDVLESAGLTANKNGVPDDPESPKVTSGLRLGSSAGTARGMGVDEFTQIGHWIADVLDAMGSGTAEPVAAQVRSDVKALVSHFPIYPT